ncbi:hypothetical protein ACFFHM_17135 [Halalkalibacter kiskunsagensis]|uniref:Uncharacterized protein n=1 Tax=Halalkalibacter kiskunsagensis TaxID=1548599 RepID=A0ABV6KGX5_9BACI
MLTVTLFILAANLMNSGQISQKLINFSLAIVGRRNDFEIVTLEKALQAQTVLNAKSLENL